MNDRQNSISNKLLRSLSSSAFEKISGHLQHVQLPHRYKISVPNVACTNVVFPNSGIASVIGDTEGIWQEVGLFGAEGAGCISTLLSSRPTPNLIVMQVSGEGYQISSEILKTLFETDCEVRELLLAYVETFIVQLSQTAIANVRRNAGQRLARWLLMIQDRLHSDCLVLTHEYVAAMLGVTRTSVTLALQDLQTSGIISTGRRLIKIESRPRLLEMAGKYYGAPEREYTKIMRARVHYDPLGEYALVAD